MPRNVHLLVYGDSFMREVGLSILCEHGENLTAIDDHTLEETARASLLALAGNASRGLSRWLALPVGAQTRLGTTGTFAFGELNSSLSFIVNHAPFQMIPYAAANLSRFLRENSFTHAAFMVPHPTCFFLGLGNSNDPYCIDSTGTPLLPLDRLGTGGARFDPSKVLQAALGPSRVANLRSWRSNHTDTGLQGGLDTYHIIQHASGFCGVPDCSPSFRGHQCMPRGPASLVANALMRSLFVKPGGVVT